MQTDVEAYGFDKAYWVIIEYSGRFDSERYANHELDLSGDLPTDIHDNGTDIIYLFYYDNYREDTEADFITALTLPLYFE